MSDEDGDPGRRAVIGGFMVGGVALALAAILLFGKAGFFSRAVRATVVFQDSIGGLAVGAPVTFHGVRVGAVESITISFDPKAQSAFIPVIVALEPKRVSLTGDADGEGIDLPRLIGLGLRAELNVQSFVTGQSEIDLEFDAAAPVTLHPNVAALTEIPTRRSTIQKVKEEIGQLPLRELAENANATLRSLRTLSDKLDGGLPALLDSVRATTDRSAEIVARAGPEMTEVQGRLDGVLATFGRLADAGTLMLNQRGGELHAMMASTNQTVSLAHDILTDLKGMTTERGADRANIDAALRDLATTAAALRGLANDVEHNPQLLLTGRRP